LSQKSAKLLPAIKKKANEGLQLEIDTDWNENWGDIEDMDSIQTGTIVIEIRIENLEEEEEEEEEMESGHVIQDEDNEEAGYEEGEELEEFDVIDRYEQQIYNEEDIDEEIEANLYLISGEIEEEYYELDRIQISTNNFNFEIENEEQKEQEVKGIKRKRVRFADEEEEKLFTLDYLSGLTDWSVSFN